MKWIYDKQGNVKQVNNPVQVINGKIVETAFSNTTNTGAIPANVGFDFSKVAHNNN